MRLLLFSIILISSHYLPAQENEFQNDRHLDSIMVSSFLTIDSITFLVRLSNDTLEQQTIEPNKETIEIELEKAFAKSKCETCKLQETQEPKDPVAYFLDNKKEGDVFLFNKIDDKTEVRLYRAK